MKYRFILTMIIAVVISSAAFSQKIPVPVQESFARQYPEAKNIKWYNDIVHVTVQFDLDGKKMDAEYNNKGEWKRSLETLEFNSLPKDVKDGFDKSKYAGRNISDVRLVYLPNDTRQYRLKVDKNDFQKKYLFYSLEGRLLRDANTL